jgi:hypothetical protein
MGGHAVTLGEIVKEGWAVQRDLIYMGTAVSA